jgi:hypothetical protein
VESESLYWGIGNTILWNIEEMTKVYYLYGSFFEQFSEYTFETNKI